MRVEKKFHKLIQKQGAEHRALLLEKIRENIKDDNIEKKPPAPRKKSKKHLWGIIAPVAAAAACAVIIPCALLLGKDDGTEYYSDGGDYTLSTTDKTLKQYNEEFGTNYLYYDLYDVADDMYDGFIVPTGGGSAIGMTERIIVLQNGWNIDMNVVDSEVSTESFEHFEETCSNLDTSFGFEIKWAVSEKDVRCTFIYEDNKYYIKFYGEKDEAFFFDKLALRFTGG